MTETVRPQNQRASDKGIMCVIARRATELWDFIDDRDIEKYIVSVVILYLTYDIVRWAFIFAENHMDKSGMELAAVIAAVMVPWSGVQAAALKWLFEARTGE